MTQVRMKENPVLAEKTSDLAGRAVKGSVYHTFDLVQFRTFRENRPIRPRSVAAMVKSLTQLNLLKHNPLIVTADGGIIDGQTRYAAVMDLQAKGDRVGIYYTVLDADIDPYVAMRTVNATSSPWSNADYLYHNYALGISPYEQVYTAWVEVRHEGLHLSTAAVLEVFSIPKNRLKDGAAFELENIEECYTALEEIKRINEQCVAFSEITEAKTISAYVRCRQHPNFNYKQIVHFFNTHPTVLSTRRAELKSANPNHRMDMLVWMHNYRRSKAKYKIEPMLLG